MSKHSWRAVLVLVIALWWAAPLSVYAIPFIPAVEYATSGDTGWVGGTSYTVGHQFSASVPFAVDALGYFVDGLGNDHQVGLWDSEGILLVSTTVLNTDPVQGHFQYHSIPTFPLAPGVYTIGGEVFGGNGTTPINLTGVVTVPGYTWITDTGTFGALNYASSSLCPCGQNAVLAANFSIASSTSAVPEPSTLLLLSAGLVGLAAWRRKHSA